MANLCKKCGKVFEPASWHDDLCAMCILPKMPFADDMLSEYNYIGSTADEMSHDDLVGWDIGDT